jgi:hypothetical protein
MDKTPQYKTRTRSRREIGIYTGQRPSVAACKAFSTLRKKDKTITTFDVEVMTEGRRNYTWYRVTYETVDDALLGSMMRPVARKILEGDLPFIATLNLGGPTET